VPLVAKGPLAAWELWRGLRGPFAGEAVVTSLLLLGAGALAAWHLASGAGIAAVRRAAWLSALITLVLVLNCFSESLSCFRSRPRGPHRTGHRAVWTEPSKGGLAGLGAG
jgi:hypothetical protein